MQESCIPRRCQTVGGHDPDHAYLCIARRVVVCTGVGALMLHISRVEKAAPAPPTPVKTPQSPTAQATSAGMRWSPNHDVFRRV